MAKIAKNIKAFRSDSGLTQDALAEKINVTRQTVSSWENGRTQPDIEMLETLSGVLGISVEELIYGKKNKVGLAPPEKPDRNIIVIVLTVFGTLMTVTGLTILFAEFWNELSFAKNFFALLPLAAGVGLTLFVFEKRRDSMAWREGAAVAWTVGIAVTNALMNSLNAVDFGFVRLLLLDSLLVIPVICVTGGIFPLAAYFFGISDSLAALRTYSTPYYIIFTVVLAALFALGAFLTVKYYFPNKIKKAVGFWVLLAAGLFNWVSVVFIAPFDPGSAKSIAISFMAALTFFIALYCFGEKLPYKAAGLLGGAGCTLVCVIMAIFFTDSVFLTDPLYAVFRTPQASGVIACALVFLTGAAAFAVNIKNLKKDALSVLFVSLALLQDALFFLCASTTKEITLIKIVPALGMAAVIIIKGVLLAKLSYANFGMLTAAAVLISLLISSDAEPVLIGSVIALTGIVLLIINKILLKRFAKESEAENHA